MLTRRKVVALLSGTLTGVPLFSQDTNPKLKSRAVVPGKLTLHTRTRAGTSPGSGEIAAHERTVQWNSSETAILICDMWDDHYCVSAARRVTAMVPQLNQVLSAAHAAGIAVIHSPSGTMDFYKDTPQRKRMVQAPHVLPPVPIARWCYLDKHAEAPLPIDDTHGPCDDEIGRPRVRMYSRQHPDIVIGPYDGISDKGQEIYNYCEQLGIRNIVMTGVHTNMCVLGRPFGIRQMKRLGRNVVLVRDLTDTIYDPRDEPYVSHERGTEMVVEHIERYWCPSILSADLVKRAPPADPSGPVSSGG